MPVPAVMKWQLFILLGLCALTAAMVPYERRAVHTEAKGLTGGDSATTAVPPNICAPQTPCGWSVYRPTNKVIDLNINNTYCICGPGLVCKIHEDDITASAYIHLCQLPSEEPEDSRR